VTDTPDLAAASRPAVHVPQPERKRVSIDAECWQAIDRLLGDLPFRTAAPIVQAIGQTGGVQPVAVEG